MPRFITFISIIPLLCATIIGCSDDSTGPGGAQVKKPGVGSTYVYSEDENPGFDEADSIVAVVLETGIGVGGKSDVYHVRMYDYRYGYVDDSTDWYLSYQSNGDLAIYYDPGKDEIDLDEIVGPLWIVLPLQSGSGTTTPLADTTVTDGSGDPNKIKFSIVTENKGSETADVNGKSMTVWKATLALDGSVTLPIVGSTKTGETYTFSFAPEIGLFTRSVRESKLGLSSLGTVTQTLVRYELK